MLIGLIEPSESQPFQCKTRDESVDGLIHPHDILRLGDERLLSFKFFLTRRGVLHLIEPWLFVLGGEYHE